LLRKLLFLPVNMQFSVTGFLLWKPV